MTVGTFPHRYVSDEVSDDVNLQGNGGLGVTGYDVSMCAPRSTSPPPHLTYAHSLPQPSCSPAFCVLLRRLVKRSCESHRAMSLACRCDAAAGGDDAHMECTHLVSCVNLDRDGSPCTTGATVASSHYKITITATQRGGSPFISEVSLLCVPRSPRLS